MMFNSLSSFNKHIKPFLRSRIIQYRYDMNLPQKAFFATEATQEGIELELFGSPLSQPTRAVRWFCAIHEIPIKLCVIDPSKGQTHTKEYLNLNPAGIVPTLRDGKFVLFESHAILIYIATKYGLKSWYPDEINAQARIHQYLHWHHLNSRRTREIVHAMYMKEQQKATKENLLTIENKDKILYKFLPVLDQWFGSKDFIATNENPTIADISCYCEIEQIELMNLCDISEYPNIKKWVERMKELPKHEEVRRSLYRLVEKIQGQNEAGKKVSY